MHKPFHPLHLMLLNASAAINCVFVFYILTHSVTLGDWLVYSVPFGGISFTREKYFIVAWTPYLLYLVLSVYSIRRTTKQVNKNRNIQQKAVFMIWLVSAVALSISIIPAIFNFVVQFIALTANVTLSFVLYFAFLKKQH